MNRRRRTPTLPVWRSRLLLGLFALAALTLEARLVWLQLIEHDHLAAEGADRQLRTVEISAHRGVLSDRRGESLGVSTPVDSIFINPQEIPLERELIFELARAVERDGAEVEREITSHRDKEFLWVARKLPPAAAARVMQLGITGVYSRREYKRYYPEHEVTCHLVGFAGDEDVGQEGLEYLFDARLAGRPGSKRVLRDERGRVIADVEQLEAARPGEDIRTSIDLRLQWPAYRALKTAVVENGASSASAVLLDIQTGEVLSMVNQPSCNPNDSAQRADSSRHRNRAITDPIEPGSTIKPFILTAALMRGYTPDTRITVPRVLEVDGREVTSDEHELGNVTVTEILARSSNVGMGTIGMSLEREEIWRTFKAFRFGESTDSDLGILESRGSVDDYRNWGPQRHATVSYGYGITVTPLQLARAYAAIASGGLLTPISFEMLTEPPPQSRIMSAGIASQLMQMLEVVVSDGTGRRAAIEHYKVAGKTGTAEIAGPGEYFDDQHRAIFAGIAPATRPRFVAVVVVNNPRGQAYHGGDVAAPVFAEIMSTALRMYGVAPDALPEMDLLSHVEERQ